MKSGLRLKSISTKLSSLSLEYELTDHVWRRVILFDHDVPRTHRNVKHFQQSWHTYTKTSYQMNTTHNKCHHVTSINKKSILYASHERFQSSWSAVVHYCLCFYICLYFTVHASGHTNKLFQAERNVCLWDWRLCFVYLSSWVFWWAWVLRCDSVNYPLHKHHIYLLVYKSQPPYHNLRADKHTHTHNISFISVCLWLCVNISLSVNHIHFSSFKVFFQDLSWYIW